MSHGMFPLASRLREFHVAQWTRTLRKILDNKHCHHTFYNNAKLSCFGVDSELKKRKEKSAHHFLFMVVEIASNIKPSCELSWMSARQQWLWFLFYSFFYTKYHLVCFTTLCDTKNITLHEILSVPHHVIKPRSPLPLSALYRGVQISPNMCVTRLRSFTVPQCLLFSMQLAFSNDGVCYVSCIREPEAKKKESWAMVERALRPWECPRPMLITMITNTN